MSSALGDLVIRIGGDITGLKDGMASGSAAVSQFARQAAGKLRGVTTNIVKMGAVATASGAVGLVALSKQATATGREIQNLSRIANSSAAEFQKMSYGSAALGIEQEKLADILKDVNDRIGEFAQTGGGEMKDFFEKIAPKVGVTAKQFQKLSGPQALQFFYSSLEKANLSQEEMTFYLEAMASDLTALQPLLANNGKLLKESGDRAQRLGIVLSDIELQQLSQGASAFREMGETIKMAGTLIGASLVPYIEELQERFAGVIGEAGGFRPVIENVVNNGITGFSKLADVIHGLKVVFKGVEVIATGFGAAVASAVQIAAEIFAKFGDMVIGDVNFIIGALNKIPNVDIAKVDPISNGAFMQGLRKFGEEARIRVGDVRSELHEMAMQPLPSENAEKFLMAVAERSKATAEEIVKVREAAVIPINTGNTDTDTGGEDEQKRALEAIKNRYVTEQELLREHREIMAVIGNEYDAAKFSSEEEWRSVKLQAEQDYLDNMVNMNQNAYRGIESIISQKWGAAAGSTAGAMKSIAGTLASGSKKAFEISKGWALADAFISTAQGIAAGVRLGWPMAIPAVAWAAATGFAQISAIRSQSYSGASSGSSGGAAAAPVSSAGVSSAGAQAVQSSAQQAGPTYTFVGIDPTKFYSGRDIAGALQDYIDNGGTLNLAA